MNFREMAKKETTLSRVMENRDKVSMDEIMNNYPGGVTITEFDFIHSTDKKGNPTTYPVCAIKENENICFFGGSVLSKICMAWVDGYNGDVDLTSDELKKSGGVKMKFEKTTTKNGNNLTGVTIL